jgi:hypothetical protein
VGRVCVIIASIRFLSDLLDAPCVENAAATCSAIHRSADGY